MRIAILVPLAFAAVVGPTTAASACSMDTVAGGTVSTVITAVGNLLGITSASPATVVAPAASSTTTNNSVTNNSATNNFSTNGAAGTTPASGTTPLTIATAGRSVGMGGGGGGGIGGLSGGGFGSTNAGGIPQSVSQDSVFAGGGPGAGGVLASGSTADAETPGVGFVMASGETDATALTTGVRLASLPGKSGSDDAKPVGMASPATDTLSLDSTPFDFGGPTALSTLPESPYGWTMLAGLLGIGVSGAGWAWRWLIV